MTVPPSALHTTSETSRDGAGHGDAPATQPVRGEVDARRGVSCADSRAVSWAAQGGMGQQAAATHEGRRGTGADTRGGRRGANAGNAVSGKGRGATEDARASQSDGTGTARAAAQTGESRTARARVGLCAGMDGVDGARDTAAVLARSVGATSGADAASVGSATITDTPAARTEASGVVQENLGSDDYTMNDETATSGKRGREARGGSSGEAQDVVRRKARRR